MQLPYKLSFIVVNNMEIKSRSYSMIAPPKFEVFCLFFVIQKFVQNNLLKVKKKKKTFLCQFKKFKQKFTHPKKEFYWTEKMMNPYQSMLIIIKGFFT